MKRKEDIEVKLEHFIKTMADSITHADPDLLRIVQNKIKKLSAELKN